MVEWTNVTVKLGDLKPWSRNPKTISKTSATRLLALWDKLGQFQTIAIGPQNEVYDGHQRLNVLMSAHGRDFEVDARQSSRELTEKEREELVVAAHVGTVGQFDWEQLSGWDAPELIEWGLDDTALKDWKQDVSALSALLESEKQEVDAEPQIDRAAELNEKWQVKTGDLWQIGSHKLLCGDSTISTDVERLMQGEKADMVTDPPYGMDLDTDWSDIVGSLNSIGKKNNKAGNKYDKVIGDDKPFDPAQLFELWNAKEMFLFGADYYCDKIPNRENGSWFVWDKRKESQSEAIGSEFELAWSKVKHKKRILRFDWFGFLSSSAPTEARNRLHPTQKPTPLIEFIVNEWCKEEVIADPYAGSGTTMVACENLHRKCRAIEISPNYCAVILERMATAFPELEIVKL